MRDIDITRMYENLENPDCCQHDAPDEPISCDHCTNLAIGEYEVSNLENGNPFIERMCEQCLEETKEAGHQIEIREEF